MKVHLRGAAISILALAVWSVLAVRSPDLTYHFAPLIAAIAWPLGTRRAEPAHPPAALSAAIAALATVSLASLILHVAGQLDGPTFLDTRPAVIEAVLFAIAGAAIGYRAATRQNAGLLGRILN